MLYPKVHLKTKDPEKHFIFKYKTNQVHVVCSLLKTLYGNWETYNLISLGNTQKVWQF